MEPTQYRYECPLGHITVGYGTIGKEESPVDEMGCNYIDPEDPEQKCCGEKAARI